MLFLDNLANFQAELIILVQEAPSPNFVKIGRIGTSSKTLEGTLVPTVTDFSRFGNIFVIFLTCFITLFLKLL